MLMILSLSKHFVQTEAIAKEREEWVGLKYSPEHVCLTRSVCGSKFSFLCILTLSIEQRWTVPALAAELRRPDLDHLIRRFLFDQLQPDNNLHSSDVDIDACPQFYGRIYVFYSASATYYAPSDPSGVGGMHREWIRATPSWHRGVPRYDCILINTDPDRSGMRGMDVARVLLFFSFEFRDLRYPCALVQWYVKISEEPDDLTGMWIVEKEMKDGEPLTSIIHLDSILRAAHLIPMFGDDFIPAMDPSDTLDTFDTFYVNKFADHHAFEIIT
jgi:hypothetical protein